MILIDTSAIIAILCREDRFHDQAKQTWFDLIEKNETIQCNNYILLEAISLIQRRHGMNILRTFQMDMMPLLTVEWLGKTEHNEAMNTLLLANRRRLSLVDFTSFETMLRQGIQKAFTFDSHFAEQGFEVIP
ncbi:MAG: PIN domain-containing protein [Chloroflexi bacterium]|nr:PIN domain-containing protein [Chloroflexota bacterium]